MKKPSNILPDSPSYDLSKHLAYIRQLHASYPLNSKQACEAHCKRLLKTSFTRVPWMIAGALYDATYDILTLEDVYCPYTPTIQHQQYLVRLQARFSSNDCLNSATKTFTDFFNRLEHLLPVSAFEDARDITNEYSLPLIELIHRPKHIPIFIYEHFLDAKFADTFTFPILRIRLLENAIRLSGFDPHTYDGKRKLTLPGDYDGTPTDCVHTYLANTAFIDVFDDPIPFSFEKQRVEHHAIYGAPGAGKTQALQHIILNDLHKPDPPALIILDSQNQMLDHIQRLDVFNPENGRLRDRLIILDPEDAAPPALNMFVFPERWNHYSGEDRELAETEIVNMFAYVFAATAQEMTAKQSGAFSYIVRAVLASDNPSILTLLAMMEDPARHYGESAFQQTIERLDIISQGFFRNQFYAGANNQTRQQIARRLYGVLRFPAFLKMFTAKENKLDLLDALQTGKIVLVNTSAKRLQEASAVFGRYIIALTLAAAFERLLLGGKQKRAYLVLDEAHEYFDEQVEKILVQARKCELGLVYATQLLEQMDPYLRAVAATATTIKFARGVSDRNARELAPDMKTSAEFISSTTKTAEPVLDRKSVV